MSFYGSIYYQLIDAFYKVVLRNKGKNSTEFIDTSSLPELFETQAAGRKSVFGFDTGNKWINLNERTEINPDADEAYSIYEIYHGVPDTEKENPGYGFKVILDDPTLNNRTKDGIIQLDFNDEFETYETVYDDAGHISSSERKVYKLPKAEVNERTDKLENLVGLPNSYKNLPEVDKKDQHLYGYVNENSKDVKLLEDYVGNWSSVVGNWEKGDEYAPTIAQTIGNIDKMYGDSSEDRIDNNHKTFAKIIGDQPDGDLPALYEKINEKNPISLIKAILKESSRLDGIAADLKTHKEASELSFSGIKALIGTSLDGEGSNVYQHIATDRAKIGTPIDDTNNIYNHITILYDDLNWPVQEVGQQKTTVSGEINRLDNKIGTLDAGGMATVASEIARLDNKVGEIPKDFTSLRGYIDTNLEEIDEIFTNDLGTNYTDDENGFPTSTAFELIQENANNISSINTFIGMVEGEEIPDENSLNTHINNIKNYVGYTTSQDGEEVISLTDQINSMGELIGGTVLGEDDEGKKKNNLITRINNLESTISIIGTSTDTKDTLYGEINNIKNDIGDVANGLKSHDFGENVTINSVTDALNNILTRLETLEEEVKNLKTETPNVPDSENPEDEQEPNV